MLHPTITRLEDIDIQPGDIVFYRTNGLSPTIIRWLQRKLFSKDWMAETNHVGVCIGWPEIIMEEVLPKTRLIFAREKTDRYITAVARPKFLGPTAVAHWLSDTKKKEFIEKTIKIDRHYYGLAQIFGILYVAYKTWRGETIDRNPIRGGSICTERSMHFKLDMEREFEVDDSLINNTIKDINSIFPLTFLMLFILSNVYEVFQIEKAGS